MAQEHLNKDLKLLIVEDNSADYIYLWELLKELNSRSRLEHWSFFSVDETDSVWVQTLSEALKRLQSESFDAVLLDLSLPDSDELESLNGIRKVTADIPIIVLSGHSRADLTFEAVTRGAQDFLVKGEFNADQLARSIRYSVERKRIERELDQASRHKSQFLANMSHELRTPITSILGFAEIMQDELAGNPLLSHPVSAVVRNAQHLLILLDDILDHSKIEAGKLEVEKLNLPLAPIIRQACSMVELQAKAKGLKFSVQGLRPIPRQVLSDPLRLKQILVNLLTNAVKFTEKGEVKLLVDFNPEKQELILDVKDSGMGIGSAKQETLFQAFTQGDPSNARQYGGSGLGLSITRHLAGLLNGRIEVESAEGAGSTFRIFLPCEAKDLQPLEAHCTAEAPAAEVSYIPDQKFSGRILLVEDTEDSREFIRLLLQRAGAQVEGAENGHDGMEKALSQPFDLVLMDMHMPRLDGYEATRALRAKGYTGIIVALTARVTEDARAACIEAGCNDYVSKPIKRKEFFRVIGQYLKSERRGPAPAVVEEDLETKRLIDSYRDSLPEKLDGIVDAIKKEDWVHLKNEAHKMANAEMFGFPEITQVARKLEKAAAAQEAEQCNNLSTALARSINEINIESVV